MPKDILFKIDDWIFSYRVAGILIHNGRILLQRPVGESSYAFPGGHVNLGETSQEALIREFKEEVLADIIPNRLMWMVENFFPWGEKRCHQVSLYYLVSLLDETQISLDGTFLLPDEEERKVSNLEFSWHRLPDLDALEVYPIEAKEKLLHPSDCIEHWVYKQD